MWLLLFCWIVFCLICMGICHCWAALKQKWELEAEMRRNVHEQRPKKGRDEIGTLELGHQRREQPRQRQQEPQDSTNSNSTSRIHLPLEWTTTVNGDNGRQQRTGENEERIDVPQRQQQLEAQMETQPAPYPASSVPSVRLPLFLRRQFTRQDHGQGPMRFRVQPIQSAAANPQQQQQQPGTSSSTSTASTSASTSASTAAKTFDLSNAALASFFGQLLSNLGVNLTNGNVYLFAEQDHDIIWLHLGQGAHDGLYAIHPNSMDDIVTELLEKFAELFIPEGLLPYELERMPRTKIDPLKYGLLMKEAKSNCTICLAQIQVGEQMTELGCHHFFHSDCIHAWLLHRNTCPTCRAHVCFEDPTKMAKKCAGVFV